MRSVYLVSCVSKKKQVSLPAKDLYDSDWFRKARAYVEAEVGCWFVLSAKYHLLDPETIIEPYEKTLKNMSVR